MNWALQVADNIYIKYIYIKNSFTYIENDDESGVGYQTDIKSAGFWSRLEASHESSHTEELWYNQTVYLFGLVSLFNGISTFIGYLMPKLFS